MRTREEVLTCPEAYPYIRVELSTGRLVALRLPTNSRMVRIQAAMDAEADPGVAALIGAAWRDAEYALEAPDPNWSDVADVCAYGERVEEELQEFGLLPVDLQLLWGSVLHETRVRSSEVSEAAAKKLRSFGLMKAEPDSSSSKSESTSLETPGDSSV